MEGHIGIAMGGSSIIAIHLVFTFSFNLNLSSKDIKVETCKKVTSCKKSDENVTSGMREKAHHCACACV